MPLPPASHQGSTFENQRAAPRRFLAAGEPADLVGPILFLASEMATYVTGAILPVDGGLLAL